MNNVSSKAALVHLWPVVQLLVMAAVLLIPNPAHADFSLQFNPVLPSPVTTCTSTTSCTVAGGELVNGGTGGGNDGSRFIQEKLYINGVNYFHVVVGSPDSNFAIESYVATEDVYSSRVFNQGGNPRPFTPWSGGNERALIGNQDVLPLAAANLGGNNHPNPVAVFGNAEDPLGASVDPASGFKSYDLSGTGTTDPTRVALRMLVSDAEVSVEVLKPITGRKPMISQTTNDSEISGLFIADMRGLSYSDSTRTAPIVNRLALNSPTLPADGIGDFDMSQVQRSYVSAGRFTYQPGQGWLTRTPDGLGGYIYTANPTGWDTDNSVFDEGSYTYTNGNVGFNLEGVKWQNFFDQSQNASYCSTGNRLATLCSSY